MEWSTEQKLAINNDDKNILVSAAAGSGKTAVLVERVVSHLLRNPNTEDNAWDIDRLLVVTFTKAAAAEMKQRIQKRLQEAIGAELEQEKVNPAKVRRLERQLILLSGAAISTIDSFCQTIIKNNFNVIDIDPKFRVADTHELEILKLDILDELFEIKYGDMDPDLVRFGEKYGSERGDGALYDIVLKIYDKAQNQPFPELWLDKLAEAYQPAQGAITSLKDTRWWPIVKQEICYRLEPAQSYAEALLEIVQDFANPTVRESFSDVAEKYKELVCAIEAGVDGGYKEIFAAFGKMDSLPSMPRLRKDVEPEVKEAFKAVHEKLKDLLKKVRDNLVIDTEEALLQDLAEIGGDVASIVRLVKAFAQKYQEAKRKKNMVDFADMEHLALAILRDSNAKPGELVPSAAALELRQQYQEIMVDEYQDTNEVQEAIISLIAGDNRANTFTVGDVKQSIYGFRSSEPGLFLKKYEAYGAGDSPGGELITLGRNFRSRREILSAVNYVFAQTMTPEPNEIQYDERAMLNEGKPYGYPEPDTGTTIDQNVELVLIDTEASNSVEACGDTEGTALASDQVAGDDVTPTNGTDAGEDDSEELTGFELEAQYIAGRLKEIKESGVMVFDTNCRENKGYRPVTWRDMVILLRSTKNKAEILQEILQQNGIPVYANANDGFFQTTEIQLMYSILSIIDNSQQDIYLAAVLFSPVVGLKADELAQLKVAAGNKGDMYSALLAANTPESGLAADIKAKVDKFLNQLSQWRQLARHISVPELIWQIFRDTGYYDYVGSQRGGMLRQANLRMLVTRAQEFQQTAYQGLFRFLRFIQRMKEMETDLSMARTLGEGEDVVRVMTIHKSKGLEFPVVVIADMCKKFNDMDITSEVLIHKDLGLGLNYVDQELMVKYPTFPRMAIATQMWHELQAEELRVLYVAMTRAREKLIMVGRFGKKFKLDKAAERWSEFIEGTDPVIPVHALLTVNRYMDWVATAVAHHRDGEAIVQCAPTPRNRAAIPGAMGEESCWAVSIIGGGDIGKVQPLPEASTDLLQIVREGRLIDGVDNGADMADWLRLDYDYRGTREVPAKLSVSEMKRLFAKDIQPEGMRQIGEQQREYIFNRPGFVQEDTGPTGLRGNEYGTLMHSVMQHLDLAGALDIEDVKQQLAGMVVNEIMTEEQATYINVKAVAAFFATELGQRLRMAAELWRELPFSRGLDAGGYYRDADGELIFSQGVIDVLFKEKNGDYVLLDYKTDRDTTPELVKDKYALQIKLYTEAVESILGIQVNERYLIMLHDNSVVEL